jgi:hypothetical protein
VNVVLLCCIALLSFSALPLSAQWMNNERYPLDSADVKIALDMMGFRIFKFPIAAPPDKKVYFNFIIETYKDSVLTNTYNAYENLLSSGLPKDFALSLLTPVSTDESFARVVWMEESPTDVSVRIEYEGGNSVIKKSLDSARYGAAQCRAMKYTPGALTTRTPVSVRYAHYADQNMIHCPGGATVDQIRALYAYVLVVYLEPIEITGEVTEK